MRTWVLLGTKEHWDVAFSRSPAVWGLTGRYFTTYWQMSRDDLLLFYAISPVKGFISYGFFLTKVPRDADDYWPTVSRQYGPRTRGRGGLCASVARTG